MAFKRQACITLHCDECGNALEADYILHFADEGDALGQASDYEWLVLRDGRVYCSRPACWAKAPDCVCPDQECDGARCPIGCPCQLHEEVKPGGECCGEMFERSHELMWHRYSKHGGKP